MGGLELKTRALEAAKSTTRRPVASAIQASRMFHSSGTVQSRTGVPDGTYVTWRGTSLPRIRSVSRTPLPVMLRHMGYSSATSACISVPSPSGTRIALASGVNVGGIEIGIGAVPRGDDDGLQGPLDGEGGVVPAKPS